MLGELIQGNDVGSDYFSPSAFLSIDTRGCVSTFGGVNQFGDTRPMNLRSRSDLSISDRYIHPTTPVKVKQRSKRVVDVHVKLF